MYVSFSRNRHIAIFYSYTLDTPWTCSGPYQRLTRGARCYSQVSPYQRQRSLPQVALLHKCLKAIRLSNRSVPISLLISATTPFWPPYTPVWQKEAKLPVIAQHVSPIAFATLRTYNPTLVSALSFGAQTVYHVLASAKFVTLSHVSVVELHTYTYEVCSGWTPEQHQAQMWLHRRSRRMPYPTLRGV